MFLQSSHCMLQHPGRFIKRVLYGFRANQGFLLAGAVAYYTLLSLVPMTALILVVLSQFTDQQALLEGLHSFLALVIPGQTDVLLAQVEVFLKNWRIVGITGLLIALFFSSFAFTALENSMSVIFFHRVKIKRRHFLVSAILPYCFILLLAAGMFLISSVSSGLHSLDQQSLSLLGERWSLSGAQAVVIYLLGVLGEIFLLSSLYLVMPVGRLAWKHALMGGVTAAVLWEITRHVLVWYFTTLSLVNVIYGTFATVIIILLSMEAAAIILLLGAQVIAEYERTGDNKDCLTTS
ncbi:MAG: YihY/virulence factor BrkB family protein [gamma proteobacterium symbiont of Bathyaustriella thionipta]|nr:YihY/virulence factor BrkB family protein [gamma proteobacterium symbiont of Bathyaustriella thionipta]